MFPKNFYISFLRFWKIWSTFFKKSSQKTSETKINKQTLLVYFKVTYLKVKNFGSKNCAVFKMFESKARFSKISKLLIFHFGDFEKMVVILIEIKSYKFLEIEINKKKCFGNFRSWSKKVEIFIRGKF